MCVFSVWGNREDPAAGESRLDLFYPFLFSSHSIIKVSLLCKLYLICFPLFCFYPSIILLNCFYLSPCVSWKSLKLRLSWCGYGVKKSARLCGPDLQPPRFSVILSRDLLPTRPCWISAICFTALAFKCLIEPLISWTMEVCVCMCDSWGRTRDDGSVYGEWGYAWLKCDGLGCAGDPKVLCITCCHTNNSHTYTFLMSPFIYWRYVIVCNLQLIFQLVSVTNVHRWIHKGIFACTDHPCSFLTHRDSHLQYIQSSHPPSIQITQMYSAQAVWAGK